MGTFTDNGEKGTGMKRRGFLKGAAGAVLAAGFLFLFPSLPAVETATFRQEEVIEKLQKNFPRGEDCAIFLVLPPELAKKKVQGVPDALYSDLLSRFDLTESSPNSSFRNELLSKGVGAAFAGNE